MPASVAEFVSMLLRRLRSKVVPSQFTAQDFERRTNRLRPRIEALYAPKLAALPWGGFVRRDELPRWRGVRVRHADTREGTVVELDNGGFRARVDFGSQVKLVRGRDLELVEKPLALPSSTPTSAGARLKANLAVLNLLASHGPPYSPAEKATLQQFTGFGGLSAAKIAELWPAGIPRKSPRALQDEYFTPLVLADAVAGLARARLDTVRDENGRVHALEPSVGIGRLLFDAKGLRWTAVEFSEVSSQIVGALRPDLELFNMPFERWYRDHASDVFQTLGVVVANPPYAPSEHRGPAAHDDPDRSTRKLSAAQYFLLRSMELLKPGGLGIFIVQHSILTEKSKTFRQQLLRRAHLAAAFRLPSDLFPGARLVVDVLIMRARGGLLAADAPDDGYIIDGRYFEVHREHILGVEETGSSIRRGYQVSGTFTGFPTFVEREPCACSISPLPRAWLRSAFQARIAEEAMGNELLKAKSLGRRVGDYAKRESSGEELPFGVWDFIARELTEWSNNFGNPWEHPDIQQVVGSDVDVGRFAGLFSRAGVLSSAWLNPPLSGPQANPPRDLLEVCERLWLRNRVVPLARVAEVVNASPHLEDFDLTTAAEQLEAGGWAIHFDTAGQPETVLPIAHYLQGDLWTRLDNAEVAQPPLVSLGARQAARLREKIDPIPFEALPEVSPKFGWLPLSMVSEFAASLFKKDGFGAAKLELRPDGYIGWANLVDKDNKPIEKIRTDRDHLPSLFIGYLNDDASVFSPDEKLADEFGLDLSLFKEAAAFERLGLPRPPGPPPWEGGLPSVTQALRDLISQRWTDEFRAWLAYRGSRREFYAESWNRQFRGWILPEYPKTITLPVGWAESMVPNWWQNQGAARLLDQRGGLLAFDVGLGKTLTAILTIALGKEQGLFRRPVVVVPNTVTWQWVAEIARALPHYRVGVIGSKLQENDDGVIADLNDSPEERAQKWLAFQRGLYDVVIVTATAFPRASVDTEALEPVYSEMRDFIRMATEEKERLAAEKKRLEKQQSLLDEDDEDDEDDDDDDDDEDEDEEKPQKAVKKKKRWTERDEERLAQGLAAFLAELNELPPKQRPDPGILWNDLGVDGLFVDEAQRYKGLFVPPGVDGSVPKFMGAAVKGSRRAWQLHARATAVRQKNGDTGVFLLSATPAKNSPLELYNALSYLSSAAFLERGITTHVAFVLRYCKFAMTTIVTTTLKQASKMALVGFKHLDELRSVIFRFAQFYNAEQVGLPLPRPEVRAIEVAMSLRQEAAVREQKVRLESAIKSRRRSDIFSALANMSLIATHPDLPDRDKDGEAAWTWANAHENTSPSSAKFERCATQILTNTVCNHLVFCQNLAAQWWFREVLVARGIPRNQILVMNAKTAPRPAIRRRMALQFTGSDPGPTGEAEIPPTHRILIANEVANEGINLQRETCAIHHLDIPWEPSTLQQRNGRGVRQGNKQDVVLIAYYLAIGSGDALRLQQISGKLNWMEVLAQGTERDTNNPAAQQDYGGQEMANLYAGDEERLENLKAELEKEGIREGHAKFVRTLARTVSLVRGQLAEAGRTTKVVEAARLRSAARANWQEALTNAPESLRPYLERATRVVFSRPVRVVGALPIWPGLMLRLDGQPLELGVMTDTELTVRKAGTATWERRPVELLSSWAVDVDDEQPMLRLPVALEDFDIRLDEPDLADALSKHARVHLEVDGDWRRLGWEAASPEFRQKAWAAVSAFLISRVRAYKGHPLPVVANGSLYLATGAELDNTVVLPWTIAGFERALMTPLSPQAKTTEIAELALEYWGLPFRRTRDAAAEKSDEPHPILDTVAQRLQDAGFGVERRDARIHARFEGVAVGQVYFADRLRWQPAPSAVGAENVQARGVQRLQVELEKCCDLQS